MTGFIPHVKNGPLVTVVSVSNSVETSHDFRPSTRAFTLQANELEDIRLSWQTGEVTSGSGDWLLLRPGSIYWEDNVLLGIKPNYPSGEGQRQETLYLHAPDASGSVDVAIIEWI